MPSGPPRIAVVFYDLSHALTTGCQKRIQEKRSGYTDSFYATELTWATTLCHTKRNTRHYPEAWLPIERDVLAQELDNCHPPPLSHFNTPAVWRDGGSQPCPRRRLRFVTTSRLDGLLGSNTLRNVGPVIAFSPSRIHDNPWPITCRLAKVWIST